MILYVNGDSHSYGMDAGGPDYSYGHHLANKLGAQFVCDAVPRASNPRIIRTTREYLANNKPDLVIIGWSTWEREEWEYDGKKFDVNGSGVDSVPKELQERYKRWVISEARAWWPKEYRSHVVLYQFHNELKNQQIPHLFFNCYSYFKIINETGRDRYGWGDNYINPYEKDYTYYFWLENQGFKPSNPQFNHYGADAHIAWADFLYPYLTKLL